MAQFDQTPGTGDKHYEGDVTWEFDGEKWVKQSPVVKTENVILSDASHPASLAASSMTLPDVPDGTDTQLEANRYYMTALRAIDAGTNSIYYQEEAPTLEDDKLETNDLWIRESDKQVHIFEDPIWKEVRARPNVYDSSVTPDPDIASAGDLYFDTSEDDGTLYILYGGNWVPAAPPVSTQGIEDNVELLNQAVEALTDTASRHTGEIADTQSTTYGLTQLSLQLSTEVAGLNESQSEQDTQIEALKTSQGEQDTKLDLLQVQIDQLAPTFERGEWDYDDGDGIANGTEYVLSGVQTQESYDDAKAVIDQELLDCQAAANGDQAVISQCNSNYVAALNALPSVGDPIKSNDWKLANKVTFSYYDLNQTGHTFEDVEVGQMLDMVCEDGSGFMVAEITGITLGLWYEEKVFDINPLQYKGVANGRTAVKIFSIDSTVDSGDLTNFVRKTGDKMTGKLETTDRIWIRPNGKGADGANNMLVVNQEEADTGSIARFQKNNADVVKVQYDGTLSVCNNRIVKVGNPTEDTDGANKQYVDNNFVSKAGDEMTGALRVEPTEGNTTLEIQGSSTSSDNSNILNVYSNKGSQVFWVDSKHAGLTGSAKTPTNDSHLVTKKYVDDRRGWGVPYKYRTKDQKAENLEPGEFFIASNNSIYCHRYDLNSKDMATSSSYVTDQNKFGLMKVYAANGNLLHMIEFKELRIGQGSNHYCRWLYTSKLKSYSSWMASETYYLADGLLFPY